MMSKPDFDQLRRERDAAIVPVVNAIAEDLGVPPADIMVHMSGRGCYCACPDGPCEHEFKGWVDFEDGNGGERVCERCGLGAMTHSIRTGP
jgi:hypothetical protein